MRHTPWIVSAAVLLCATAASARDRDNDGSHEHDGFYLRLQLGGGYTRAEVVGDDLAIKGGGAGVNAEIGAALTRNFILYGKLFGTSAPNPDIEVGDLTIEGNNDDVSQNYGALGVGVTYYIMPANVYLSGAVSFAQLSVKDDGETVAETDLGGGLHLGIGKEWWVSDNWGLGIGAELALGRVPEKNDSAKWNVVNGMVFLSATFN
ncbi:outer membrane beta-barrel protein [Pyxidicoccus parkwayensis]|uniref:Outer membrane beta-barrel protein n=1 Tax=Pyxidicoccus parkwayensis TaxID=2813578 RepID=A0ABX7NSG6_9BACT|nr:outer membrane beta-barrel protein [Pyxidicoccus parkwaysis]QSQ20341.1 outer membrane beta-barrel protein [Pyxidicoccus parkwaysis]